MISFLHCLCRRFLAKSSGRCAGCKPSPFTPVLHKLSLRRPSKSANTYTIEQCSNEDLRWCDVTDPYLDPPLPSKTAQLCPSHMPAPSGVRDCYRCVPWNMHATTTCLTCSSNGRLSSSSEPVQGYFAHHTALVYQTPAVYGAAQGLVNCSAVSASRQSPVVIGQEFKSIDLN